MRHEREVAAQKMEWQALSIERKRLWQQWAAEFGQRPRQRQSQGSGGRGDARAPSPAPRRAKDQFPDARRKPLPPQSADPRKQVEKPAPRPADSRGQRGFHSGGGAGRDATETRLETPPQRRRAKSRWQLQTAAAQGADARDLTSPDSDGPSPALFSRTGGSTSMIRGFANRRDAPWPGHLTLPAPAELRSPPICRGRFATGSRNWRAIWSAP
jgi:hypothetical protein